MMKKRFAQPVFAAVIAFFYLTDCSSLVSSSAKAEDIATGSYRRNHLAKLRIARVSRESLGSGGFYGSGISPQPDELTALMPAFWLGGSVLPLTVPPQPPTCLLWHESRQNRAATRPDSADGLISPCFVGEP
jgi:hypothetical protein